MKEPIKDPDGFVRYPEIHNHTQLGMHVLKKSGLIQIPDEWTGAIDFEAKQMNRPIYTIIHNAQSRNYVASHSNRSVLT